MNTQNHMTLSRPFASTRHWLLAACMIVLALLPQGGLRAGEKPVYTYEGRISGVYCSACSAKVKAALGKLDGVSKVKITAAEELGVQALLVLSTSPGLTKEAAIAALGVSAKEFTILQFGRKP